MAKVPQDERCFIWPDRNDDQLDPGDLHPTDHVIGDDERASVAVEAEGEELLGAGIRRPALAGSSHGHDSNQHRDYGLLCGITTGSGGRSGLDARPTAAIEDPEVLVDDPRPTELGGNESPRPPAKVVEFGPVPQSAGDGLRQVHRIARGHQVTIVRRHDRVANAFEIARHDKPFGQTSLDRHQAEPSMSPTTAMFGITKRSQAQYASQSVSFGTLPNS